jgi:hypothetical protein
MFQQDSDYISRSITTHVQMRRLPHQDSRHSTVDHGDNSDAHSDYLDYEHGKTAHSDYLYHEHNLY